MPDKPSIFVVFLFLMLNIFGQFVNAKGGNTATKSNNLSQKFDKMEIEIATIKQLMDKQFYLYLVELQKLQKEMEQLNSDVLKLETNQLRPVNVDITLPGTSNDGHNKNIAIEHLQQLGYSGDTTKHTSEEVDTKSDDTTKHTSEEVDTKSDDTTKHTSEEVDTKSDDTTKHTSEEVDTKSDDTTKHTSEEVDTKSGDNALPNNKSTNSWDPNACNADLSILDSDHLVVLHEGTFGTRSVFAKCAVQSQEDDIFYYEVKIVEKSGVIFIGLANKSTMSLAVCVGYAPGSYAYSSGGYFFDHNVKGQLRPTDTLITFGVNDIIGCGVNLETNQIMYTKNGVLLGVSDLTVGSSTDLFPCVSLLSPGNKIEANFGPDFAFGPLHEIKMKIEESTND